MLWVISPGIRSVHSLRNFFGRFCVSRNYNCWENSLKFLRPGLSWTNEFFFSIAIIDHWNHGAWYTNAFDNRDKIFVLHWNLIDAFFRSYLTISRFKENYNNRVIPESERERERGLWNIYVRMSMYASVLFLILVQLLLLVLFKIQYDRVLTERRNLHTETMYHRIGSRNHICTHLCAGPCKTTDKHNIFSLILWFRKLSDMAETDRRVFGKNEKG